MPSFYPFKMPQQLPLTPPEFFETCPDNAVGRTYQSSQCAGQVHRSSRYGNYDFGQLSLTRISGYTSAPIPDATPGKENERRTTNEMIVSSHAMACGLKSSTVPVLPPIYVPERTSLETRQLQARPAVPAPPIKEEKATGGVAAHLDYEMDQMAEFVAEMAQGIVNPNISVAPTFRKYVLQVLSSTRLPSSTILLGLHYLVTRMSTLSSGGCYPLGKGQVYHMLTTALLLGSKFLDDNTFQNRSWSEVSNIPVSELNVLEIEWLVAIGWDLHVDPEDCQGFTLWRTHWQRWQAKHLEMSLDSLKLTTLDVNLQRLQQVSKTQRSPVSMYSPVYNETTYSSAGANNLTIPPWRATGYDQWVSIQAKTDYSPPSAPETGPTTPEWYRGSTDCGFTCLSQPASANAMRSISNCSYPSFQRTAYSAPYPRPWITRKWNGHPISCNCMGCIPSPERYLVGSGYRLQSVFG